MIPLTTLADPASDSGHGGDRLAVRERRAGRVASEQGLKLSRAGACCGGDDPYRYNLTDQRYGQPAATHLKLDAIEAWLGIHRKIPRH